VTTSRESKEKKGEATGRDRILTVIVFALFFSWLLAFSFEGRVLYAITDFYGVSAQTYVFGAIAAQFAGLLTCGFFVRTMRAAKKLILFSIVLCAAATSVFFFQPSFLWMAALLSAAFFVGCCVAAWGYYFKGCTPKGERIKTMADALISSNILMILLNMTAIHISPQIGLGSSILMLVLAFFFALRLPKEGAPQKQVERSAAGSEAIRASKFGALAFLCLFIVVITINSGLMYQVVNPAFVHLKLLTSLYWAVPYIAALLIMRNLPRRISRSYILYVAIAMIGISFILFILLGRSWPDYLLVNTLMLGACGVYDLFWWSILGDILELDKNPAKILGIGLASNVLGVLLGGFIGNAIGTVGGSEQHPIFMALGVVCITLILLPPLHNRLTKLLKSHVFLTAFAEMPEKEQRRKMSSFNPMEPLTARESEVMELLIHGRTYKEIAAELFISENTIGSHARNIYAKAEVTNRVELMDLFLNPPDPDSEQEQT